MTALPEHPIKKQERDNEAVRSVGNNLNIGATGIGTGGQ